MKSKRTKKQVEARSLKMLAASTRHKAPDLTSCDPCHALDNHPRVNIQPRYINIAAITTEGRTIHTQIWTNNVQDARDVLIKWMRPEEEKWHGQLAIATIHDPVSGTWHFRRDGVGLFRLDATTLLAA